MKRGTVRHPKVARLKRELGCSLVEAVGMLEVLFQFTSEYAPAGDIGRFADEDIAAAMDLDLTRAAELVRCLAAAGWIDSHEEHRFVVHDWPDHAEDSVHMRLARAGRTFADGTEPKSSRLSRRDRRAHAEPENTEDSALCAHGMRTADARPAHVERTAPAPARVGNQEHTHPRERESDSEPAYMKSPPLPPPREGPTLLPWLTEMPEGYQLEPILEWLKIETQGLPEAFIRAEWPRLMSAQNLKAFQDPRKRAKLWMLDERKKLAMDVATDVRLDRARSNLGRAARASPVPVVGRTAEGLRINTTCPDCHTVYFEDEGHACSKGATA